MAKIEDLKEDIYDYKEDRFNKISIKHLRRNYEEFADKILKEPDTIIGDIKFIEDKIKLYLDDGQLEHNDIKFKITKELIEVINELYIEKLLLFIFDNYSWPKYIENEDDDISSTDIIASSNEDYFSFNGWRENQIEAFKIHEEKGWISGIHCQSTGTGKSLIFISK